MHSSRAHRRLLMILLHEEAGERQPRQVVVVGELMGPFAGFGLFLLESGILVHFVPSFVDLPAYLGVGAVTE